MQTKGVRTSRCHWMPIPSTGPRGLPIEAKREFRHSTQETTPVSGKHYVRHVQRDCGGYIWISFGAATGLPCCVGPLFANKLNNLQ